VRGEPRAVCIGANHGRARPWHVRHLRPRGLLLVPAWGMTRTGWFASCFTNLSSLSTFRAAIAFACPLIDVLNGLDASYNDAEWPASTVLRLPLCCFQIVIASRSVSSPAAPASSTLRAARTAPPPLTHSCALFAWRPPYRVLRGASRHCLVLLPRPQPQATPFRQSFRVSRAKHASRQRRRRLAVHLSSSSPWWDCDAKARLVHTTHRRLIEAQRRRGTLRCTPRSYREPARSGCAGGRSRAKSGRSSPARSGPLSFSSLRAIELPRGVLVKRQSVRGTGSSLDGWVKLRNSGIQRGTVADVPS